MVAGQGNETGAGFFHPSETNCLSPGQSQAIIEGLKEIHKTHPGLQKYAARRSTTSFIFPVRYADHTKMPGLFGISMFFDHDTKYSAISNANVLDYNCGNRSYDYEFGNHQGTDIFAWPFGWRRMFGDEAIVVAAADGMIIDRNDGNYDRNCEFCSNCHWNAVYLQHPDGKVTWYGHLKRGSLTSKRTGESVEQGEYLGVMGSSGNSTGPHLHFQVWASNDYDDVIDPYKGSCNPTTEQSLWSDQETYYAPGVAYAMVGDNPPMTHHDCGFQMISNEVDTIRANTSAYFTGFFRDQQKDKVARFRIYNPDGELYSNWTKVFMMHYGGSWWWYQRGISKEAKEGQYRFEVEYETDIKYRNFFVKNPLSGHPKDRNAIVIWNQYEKKLIVKSSIQAIGSSRIMMYDMVGRLVVEAAFDDTINLPLNSANAGVYVVYVTDEKGKLNTHRILISE